MKPKNTTIGNASKLFNAGANDMDDLGAGIRPSFATLSIRGGRFRTRYRKVETPLLDQNGRAVSAVEVVLLASARVLSKAYFDKQYQEGDDYFPSCTSSNGVKPDAGVVNPVNPVCATCPNNEITPVQTDRGVIRMKKCGDKKRVAIVPATDIANEMLGGPMLLLLPQSSHKNLQAYNDWLKSNNELYYAYTTWLSFDPDPSFPRLKFEIGRALTDDEAMLVIEHRAGDQIKRMINDELPQENVDETEYAPDGQNGTGSNGEQKQAAPQAPQKAQEPAPAQQAPPPKAARAQPPASQQAPAAAPKQGGVIPPKQAGGFAVRPGTTGPVRTTTQGIAEAVAKPAAPPPSQRQVAQSAEEEIDEEQGELPDDLDKDFGNLMSQL